MPLLRTETIHDWMCKIYDKDRVMVGTTARRFTMNVPADETSWVATRLRAELIKRELANAEELPIGGAGGWGTPRCCLVSKAEPTEARRGENLCVCL